jgi:hypothetical protein
VRFIVRYYGDMARLHVAEQAIESGLPEWRKMPYCRNGGLNLKKWQLIELDPEVVALNAVCGACLRRLEANGYAFDWGSAFSPDPLSQAFDDALLRDGDDE